MLCFFASEDMMTVLFDEFHPLFCLCFFCSCFQFPNIAFFTMKDDIIFPAVMRMTLKNALQQCCIMFALLAICTVALMVTAICLKQHKHWCDEKSENTTPSSQMKVQFCTVPIFMSMRFARKSCGRFSLLGFHINNSKQTSWHS